MPIGSHDINLMIVEVFSVNVTQIYSNYPNHYLTLKKYRSISPLCFGIIHYLCRYRIEL